VITAGKMENRNCCVKCGLDDSDKIFPCDYCKSYTCVKCAGLTASEVACLRLKNSRKLIFLCDKCENGLWKVPELIKEVHDLKEAIKKIEKKLESAEATENDVKVVSNDFSPEQLVNEINERQKRASNIIVFNVNESSKALRSDRISDDKNAISQILQDINVNVNNIDVFRLGKFQQNKIRPMKVCFRTREEALQVLKNKKSIRTPNIKIVADQTRAQREYFDKVKTKLDELKRNSENKIIRFVNNVPAIVDANQSKN
jgi:hypothetical protein